MSNAPSPRTPSHLTGEPRAPRVLVVQHELDDPLGDLVGPLVEAGVHLTTWFTQGSDASPVSIDEVDGIVTMGAHPSVLDLGTTPWMQAERDLLVAALERDVPVLGICFGCQLLASAAGGRNSVLETPEVGWCDVTLTPEAADDALLGGLPGQFRAMQYHYDTFEIPSGATLLATNTVGGRTVNEAYRVGDSAWGLQFHIEAGPAVVHSWMGSYAEPMGALVDLEAVRAETAQIWRDNRARAEAVSAAFAEVVRARTQG